MKGGYGLSLPPLPTSYLSLYYIILYTLLNPKNERGNSFEETTVFEIVFFFK
jgi:hypothetical protein